MGIKLPPATRTQEAEDTPMDNKNIRDNDFKAENVQEGLEEIDFRRETKEPTGFVDETEVRIHYDDISNKIQLIPTGTEFTYFIWGCEYSSSTTIELVHPITEGYYQFYLEPTGTIAYTYNSARPYDDESIRICATYYDATNSKVIWFAHTHSQCSMPWGSVRRLAQVERAGINSQDFLIQNFVTNGDGSLDSHAQFGLTEGTIYHKDLAHDVVHTTTPTNHWEQDIDSQAKIPIYYKTGVGLWRKKDANSFPLIENSGTGRIYYNEFNGSTWGLTEAGNNQFVAVYYYASLNVHEPIIGVLGSLSGSSPRASISEADKTLFGFPNAAFAFIKAAVWQTSDSFTNTPKARLFALTEGISALTNDRYLVTSFFGGNANNNRYLEYLDQADSLEQPLLVPEDSFVRTVTIQASSVIDAGKSIGFYDINNLTTPLFTVVVPVGGQDNHKFNVTEFLPKDTRLVIKVVNGSFNKPVVRLWIETSS